MLNSPTGPNHLTYAIALAIGMTMVVGTALGFEHIGGFIPCKLCLEQRIPYYAAIPVAVIAAITAYSGKSALVTRVLLLLCGFAMTYGLYLGIYHSGVEWGWWPGPTDCGVSAGAGTTSAGNLLEAIDKVVPPSCDEAAGRFLGLSFAGWNVIASLVLAAIAYRATFMKASR